MALSLSALSPASVLAVPQVFLAGDVPLAGNTTRPAPDAARSVRPRPQTRHRHEHGAALPDDVAGRARQSALVRAGADPSPERGLGIEAYYISFTDHNRSIADDAREIGEAVQLILQRHDPAYVPGDPQHPTNVQVVPHRLQQGHAQLAPLPEEPHHGSFDGFRPARTRCRIPPGLGVRGHRASESRPAVAAADAEPWPSSR